MEFHVIGSGSKGNCYLFKDDDGKVLILEAGVKFSRVMEAIDYEVENVLGVLITHEHSDHCKYVVDARKYGINIFALEQTIRSFNDLDTLYHIVKPKDEFELGKFRIKTFELHHNVPIVGFLIYHPEMGNTIFVTDTTYIPYTFKGLNNIIIEANFSLEQLNSNLFRSNKFLRNRIMEDHMSFETTLLTLSKNDLRSVNNIVLVHLSVTNADEEEFARQVIKYTGKRVFIAKRGLVIKNFNIQPF